MLCHSKLQLATDIRIESEYVDVDCRCLIFCFIFFRDAQSLLNLLAKTENAFVQVLRDFATDL